MQLTLKARVDQSEMHNSKCFTIVTCPAPDAFSHPSRFKVASAQPFASPGQTVELKLKVNGMVREKSYRDKNTGMQKTFHEPSVLLDVIDSKIVPLQAVETKAG